MPFEIVRNDITNIIADAIVNTANPKPIIGDGTDRAIHEKAGPELLEARKKIGSISVGDCAATPAFGLNAKYILHTVSPFWIDGSHNEEQLLRRAYDRALELALELQCESIAFPLLSSGTNGFDKKTALKIAVSAFSDFLLKADMHIILVVYDSSSVAVSEKLFSEVKAYIDDNYIAEREFTFTSNRRSLMSETLDASYSFSDICAPSPVSLEEMLRQTDAGFSETLMKLIDERGLKDSYVYKKANIDRKLFSKIRSNPDYRPGKATCLAFCFALELTLEQSIDLIGRAGHALSHSSKFDIIVEYFIKNSNYDLFELNEVLFAFDQPLIGG